MDRSSKKANFLRTVSMTVALSGILLCGCVQPHGDEEDPKDSSQQAESLSDADSLARAIAELRAALEQRAEQIDARLAALEQATAAAGSAESVSESDFTYEPTDGGVLLMGWSGEGKTLAIPQTLGGQAVVAIADGAFRDHALVSVTLPDGVKTIGWFAFAGCYALRNVTVPASVSSIGYGAFDRCADGLRFVCPVGSYAAQYAASYGIATAER